MSSSIPPALVSSPSLMMGAEAGSSDDDDDKTVYPLDEEGPTLEGDDVWIETPHPDENGDMSIGGASNVEDYDTFLPEDIDMMDMLTSFDNTEIEGAAHGGGGGGERVVKLPPRPIRWAAGIPDCVSLSATATRPLLNVSQTPKKSLAEEKGVKEHAFFVPVLAFTEMHGSVELEFARSLQEQLKRQILSRRRAQAYMTYRLTTSVQKLPPAQFRVTTTTNQEGSCPNEEDGYFSFWELRTSKTHPVFQYYKGPPFNPTCTLFSADDYTTDGSHPVRSPTTTKSSSAPAPSATLAVDGGVCVGTWGTVTSSMHWSGGGGGCKREDQSTDLTGNRSLFAGISGGTVPSPASTPSTIVMAIPPKVVFGEVNEAANASPPPTAATPAPRGSGLAAAFGQRRPLRGWAGEGAEAGANAAVQHRAPPRPVEHQVQGGFMQPSVPSTTLPSWMCAEEEEGVTTSTLSNGAHPLVVKDLTSALGKITAQLNQADEPLRAALLELYEATSEDIPAHTSEQEEEPSTAATQ